MTPGTLSTTMHSIAPDVEKRAGAEENTLFKPQTDTAATISEESSASGPYAKLQRLASRWHVEKRGIERVPEEERNDNSYLNIGSMWLAAVWSRIRRLGSRHHLFQCSRHPDRLPFLDIWPCLWTSPDGALEILVRMVGGKVE